MAPKHTKAKPTCIKDPTTNELITDPEGIKATAVKHNINILTRNPVKNWMKYPEVEGETGIFQT